MTPFLPDEAWLTASLATLVGFKTENPPGRETEAIEWLADQLRALGHR